MDSSLTKIGIAHLLKFPGSFEGIEVHVQVAGKFIKLNYPNESFTEILKKLQAKGVEFAYVQQADSEKIMEAVKTTLNSKFFYDPATTDEVRVQQVEGAANIAKDFIRHFGIDKTSLDVLKVANEKTMNMIKEAPGLHAFVKRFRGQCSEEYLKSSLTNFLVAMVLEKFPWKSLQIVHKTMTAGMLCDVTLLPEDFDAVRLYEKGQGEISERVRQHPIEVSQMLRRKKELIPMETITIIEQHHERPDGKGFPVGITVSRFNQLSAIFIVSQRFIENLFENKFDFTKRHEIIYMLQSVYAGGFFDKAMDALISVVDE